MKNLFYVSSDPRFEQCLLSESSHHRSVLSPFLVFGISAFAENASHGEL